MSAEITRADFAWVPPEIVAHERMEAATTADELRSIIINPPAGEFRFLNGDGLVQLRLHPTDEGGEFAEEWIAYEGDAADYQAQVYVTEDTPDE